jgi:hypothetical protein
MSAKARPKIPTWVRRRESARRWFSALWRDLRESRNEHSDRPSKPQSGGPAPRRSNPWPRCTSCKRRKPASAYECDEPEHAELCNSCCGCSSGGRGGGGGGGCSCSGRCDCADRDDDYGDDEQETDQGSAQADDENKEDDNDDHH